FEGKVPCCTEQKRSKRSPGFVERVRTSEQRNKDVLSNVFSRFRRTGHPPRETVHRILVFPESGLELRVSHSSSYYSGSGGKIRPLSQRMATASAVERDSLQR